MVDCGPGRYALWKKLKTESAVEVSDTLLTIILERGPMKEVLMDNSCTIRSLALAKV